MYKRTFLRALCVLPVIAAAILYATSMMKPNYLIAPPKIAGFEDNFETVICLVVFPFFTFILTNPFEIELGLTNGCGTLKLAASKAVPVFVYSLIPAAAAVALYRYVPFNLVGYETEFEIYVPDDFRFYMFVSVFVSLLFFSSVYFFLRVLMKNCFLPIVIDLTFWMSLSPISAFIRNGDYDIRLSLLDPFITRYFVGNTVPNRIAGSDQTMFLMKNAWTVNRLIFLILSLGILAATALLLRRERLHRGIWEG